jgi:RNA polymerase sigma-70 factor (ECF subfamily)
MESIFDARWHRRALAGDGEAVDALTAAALDPLYRFCFYRVGRDRHLCEDVVQETLLRAIGELDRYDPRRAGGDIFGWLTGLARNEIRRALAHSRSSTSLEAMWTNMDNELLTVYAKLDGQDLPEELLGRAETREMVNAAMSQLPPRYGQALEAKYLHGRSVREIAAGWRTSEKAVESLLGRAREAFRRAFLALARNLNVEPGTF